ncbi:MAG: homoserine dehydrogenase [Peptococcaceae bacterium]|jgi:homoserine dehydrogenase|nr:homoserine dehydrogenase [Peptococcaceae bacterium]
MRTINVAVLGLGTVGQGVVKVLREHEAVWPQKCGARIEVKKALEKYPDRPLDIEFPADAIVSDWKEVVDDPEIDVVVEVIGGIEPARTFILDALKHGKNVATANKDLLAVHGQEILNAAEAAGKDFFFEASVGGAIPIIGPLRQSLIASDIQHIIGIVNGTTNYILTRMASEGVRFDDALKDAQALGYAEVDPTADVDGIDAARKVAIMATLAFHSKVTLKDVYMEGIKEITPEDIKFAAKMGYAVKLLGICREEDQQIEARVHPALIPSDHPLASVNHTFNAIFVKGDAVDETMFYGRGAGRMPTASAIAGDVVEISRNILADCCGRIKSSSRGSAKAIRTIANVNTKFFLRMVLEDKPGVLAQVSKVFGEKEVSIAMVLQTNRDGDGAELVVITHKVREGNLWDALHVIEKMPITKKIITVLRVEGEE